jgi:extracellular factor (EF) 3-hydroxypalmitic acid methyl ester biosynthesis protein
MQNAFVSCTLQGSEISGTILSLDRLRVAFEAYHPTLVFRTSQVLDDLKIFVADNLAYSGRAVISNSVCTGSVVACEAKLEEPGAQPECGDFLHDRTILAKSYDSFFRRWQSQALILPEFKSAVLDLQSYLSDLKLFLDQVEAAIVAHPSRSRSDLERQVSEELAVGVLRDINSLHERFEDAATHIQPHQLEAHVALARRQLHPLFLCSPFGYRTYRKPLGFAGDYEIMNMIHRNTFEGGSLYAKMVHYWLVRQWAAESVRNRAAHMKRRLLDETLRALRQNRNARILNMGCGPAHEVQDFISEASCSDGAEVTLADFDSETIDHAATCLSRAKALHRRRTEVHVRRLSVNQLLKFSAEPSRAPVGMGFDMIYCGGLFDYLSDRICVRLVKMFYECLAPHGLLVVANMDDRVKPFRHMVEHLLDWHLIYRDAPLMASFRPAAVPAENWSIVHEPVAANLFLEVRKPSNG